MHENEVMSFHVCGYSRGHQILSVCAVGDGSFVAHCTKKYSADDIEERDTVLEAAQIDAFFSAAEDMGVFSWESRYVKSPMDGSDWSLSVNYGEHEGFSSRGLSNQPTCFYDFLRLLADVGL